MTCGRFLFSKRSHSLRRHKFKIIAMAEKRNIFLVGPMGAGKSTIGRQLAQLLNMDFVDTDAEIEERAGADIGWIFDVEGEEGFRKREERLATSRHRVIDRWRRCVIKRQPQSPFRARHCDLPRNHRG